ncbi:tryptophan--tRNA ligase [candidate division Kazan bacterium RIFCSPLOWO2_01_FULL_48_13]|uniref:Tryptophan--tRNA ligase n=1 Tax=candidate division Kazan bacterium RIFCSPLOWO2_01_FULL_48_13 TaxID=1798539 RepID=A0A1F4PP37_UNCK3|nr:MAG: tryptophan--tRNA ligase [candidate division Kazan bacterium RIFCSPLOWO2_01_FULL_48_13]
MKKVVLSGIKPSGIPHLGNYVGAISYWVGLQNQYDQAIFPVVDLHAITVPQTPKVLTEQTYLTAAIILASGIDPKRSIIFIQSHLPAHSELMWLLTTISTMGELNRMTQYKDKIQKTSSTEGVGVGLFTYPVLMAADIFLYQANVVPVGEDQKQHVELARNLAERFNKRFGKTFVVPEPILRKEGARIMDLLDPTKKMSKSDTDSGCILLTDSPEVIRQKLMRAVTDSGTSIKFDPNRKGLHNLLIIYKVLSGKTESQIEKHFAGKGYRELKRELAELIIAQLSPIQKQVDRYMKNKKRLDALLKDGAKRADKIAQKTLADAKHKIGLI